MSDPYDFEVIQSQQLSELASKATLYRHKPTGAELLSLENEDENKVFGVAFRTVPTDSTGVAHILEHSVLAGSAKYPVKEPFIELVKGSLASYVNALTFQDKTVYPVASQNLQDFHNLIEVYLDAVFHPLLKRSTFDREGWHFTLENPQGPLGLKGVVFNEMKGALSNPDDVLFEDVIATLLPDTPYAHDSGGYPAAIPDLTYAQFQQFYRVYYHPSNARFFFYGDDPLEQRFDALRPYLANAGHGPAAPQIPLQVPFTSPHFVERNYPEASMNPEDQKHALSVSWLLQENTDPLLALSIGILGHILMGTPASPLRKVLVESNFGEDVFGSGVDEAFGLFSMLRQLYFIVGLKGVSCEHVNRVEPLILETLDDLVSSGIDPVTVQASINTIEFELRENNYGRYPRGLVLFLRALSTWKFGGDPFSPLRFETPLAAIKKQLECESHFFELMLHQHLLSNAHRVTLHMTPDPAFQEKLEQAERSRLEQVSGGLSQVERERVLENTREIQRIQETPDRPEDLAKLPMLTLDDLEKQTRSLPIEIIEAQDCPIWIHPLPTNGIVYVDLGFDLHTLPTHLLAYLPVYGRALIEMGTQQRGYVELSQRIGNHTGGIEPTTFISSHLRSDESQPWLFLRGKAMVDQSEALFDITRELLLEPRFEQQERFRQIVLEEKARMEADLLPAGHQVVNRRIRSGFDEAGWADEQINGLDSLFFFRRLIKRIDEDWPSVVANLQEIHSLLIRRPSALFNLTFTESDWPNIEPHVRALRAQLPGAASQREQWKPEFELRNQGLSMPAQVNYVGKGIGSSALSAAKQGQMLIASRLLNTTWLWESIRLQGGAYGAWCLFDPLSKYVGLVSYRDPQVLGTLHAFDACAEYLRKLQLDQVELTKSIIGVIGQMDAYLLPDAKGFSSMTRRLTGLTDDVRQEWRDQVLSTSNTDLQALGDVFDEVAKNGRIVVLGSQSALESALGDQRPGWLEITPVL